MTALTSDVSQAPEAFGSLLRRYRRARGQSQEVLAERSGLSVRGIADLERGARRFPYADTVNRLAVALALTADERRTLDATRRRPRLPRREVGPTVPTPRHNLPDTEHALIGRETDLDWARQLLARPDVRLLSLTGSGGVGKTRLAVALAHASLADFPDGVWFVDVSATDGSQPLAISIRCESQSEPMTWLESARALVVLDGCEASIADCAEFAARVLQSSRSVRILTTSRQPLGISGECVWQVPPLASEYAVRLFVERARARDASFAPTPADLEVLEIVSAVLEGVPLSIELAAGRSRVLTPTQVLARLNDPLTLLSAGSWSMPPRHQSVRASLDWSYRLLSVAERRLLEQVSGFSDAFTLEDIESLGGTATGDELLTSVGGLMDKSMLDGTPRAAQMHYRLPILVRQYARERQRGRSFGDVVRVRAVRAPAPASTQRSIVRAGPEL